MLQATNLLKIIKRRASMWLEFSVGRTAFAGRRCITSTMAIHNRFFDRGKPERLKLYRTYRRGSHSVSTKRLQPEIQTREEAFTCEMVIMFRSMLSLRGLNTVFQKLQQIPEISARQKPQTLGKRIEYLKSFVEISIRIYKLSSLSSIGGEVLTVGIRPDGSYLN